MSGGGGGYDRRHPVAGAGTAASGARSGGEPKGGGGVAHPPAISTAMPHSNDHPATRHPEPWYLRPAKLRSISMEWVLLEAGVALLLAVLIVWWLMKGKK